MSLPATESPLSAKHVMEYPYRRSLGPVLSRFFTGLRDRRIEGIRTEAGRVLVPPSEYDPETGDATTDFVEVGPSGVVTSWAWVHAPREQHPLDRPFAFALIQLDGADTSMVHAVDTGSAGESGMSTGMRVTPLWADETVGQIQDIRCFTPLLHSGQDVVSEERGPVKSIITPVRLEYDYTPGVASSRFLKAIAEKRLVGQRCPETGRVYIPPRGSSPTHGVPTVEEVEVADKGTVVSYSIVRVPSATIEVELPYVAANILLDGADIAFQALLRDVDLDTMRMGLRVQAVWVDDSELGPTFENIKWFVPIDEPDTPFDDFKEHL